MRSSSSRDGQLLGVGALLIGLLYSCVCIAGRVLSPWPLEWMEGASVLHAQRILRGLPLHAAPRADFIAFIYPPLSYLPMALGLLLSGGALWGARLASLVALALCGGALFRAARHVSGSSSAGCLAAGLFYTGYSYTGAFIDLARVDAWFCALSLWGVERLCAGRRLQGLLLLTLACFAKQHALLLLAAASGEVLCASACVSMPPGAHSQTCEHVGRSWREVACAWAALALGCLLLSVSSAGWFWTYCVRVPQRHGLAPSLLASFVLVDLFVYLPVLSALCVWAVWKRRGAQARMLHLLLLAAVAVSALGRAHPGGDDNVRLPAFALISLVAAVSGMDLLQRLRGVRRAWSYALLGALGLQLAILLQPPALHRPSADSAASFSQLRAALVRCAGSSDFAAMDHSGLGARPFVHTLALSDLRMNRDALARQASDATLAALRAPDRPAAFAISAAFPELMQALAEGYTLCERLPPLHMPTGYSLATTFVYKRRELGAP